MAAKSNGAESLRAMIAKAVATDSSFEQVEQLVADVFTTSKARKIACPECGVEFRAALPDVKAQVDTLISLLEQAEGKASSEQLEATTVTIVRPPRG